MRNSAQLTTRDGTKATPSTRERTQLERSSKVLRLHTAFRFFERRRRASVTSPKGMALLTETYRAAGTSGQRWSSEAPSDLDSMLAVLCARGRAAHPGLPLADETFVAHLARCGAAVAGNAESLCAEDLFLVSAALAGVSGAAAKLQRGHRRVVAAYLRPLAASADLVAEVEQMVWSRLLVGDALEPAKLFSYSGKGALAGFVGISAQRLALTMLRRQATEMRVKTAMSAPTGATANDGELALIKRRYRDAFQQAFSAGLALLDNRERMVFRMRVVENLDIDRIAKVYGVNRSTVSRWLASARETVLSEARRILRERLSLTASEFESVAGVMVSQLDVSVSSILGS
jgi:RNA polymerase sigma-70 factor (ECF subfamily)